MRSVRGRWRSGRAWFATCALAAVLVPWSAGARAGDARRQDPGRADFDLANLNGPVTALAIYGGDLIAGGAFTTAGGVPAPYLARWSPATGWSAVDPELDGPVSALAVYQNALVAGGSFTHAGEEPARFVARWDGTRWSALGIGTNGPVQALAVHAGVILYAGGSFDSAGAVVARGVARWTVTRWDSVGGGLEGDVRALAIHNGIVVAGGEFHVRGAPPYEQAIAARFTSGGWSRIAPYFDGGVSALAVYNGELYMAGDFSMADFEQAALGVARWVGGRWNRVGLGFTRLTPGSNAEVRVLAVDGDGLVAGGSFDFANQLPVGNVARWTTAAEWQPLGAGTNDAVNALLADADRLFAGGDFTTAGGRPASHVAGYTAPDWFALTRVPVELQDFSAARTGGRVRLAWRLGAAARDAWRGVDVQRAFAIEGPYETRTAAPLAPAARMEFEDTDADPARPCWVRLLFAGDGGRAEASPPIELAGAREPGGTALHAPRATGPHSGIVFGYRLAAPAGDARLDLFDVRGRLVRRIASGARGSGEHRHTWDRTDASGRPVPRGVYFVRLEAEGTILSRRLPLLQR